MSVCEQLSYEKHPAIWNALLNSDRLQYPLGFPSDQLYNRAYASDWSFKDISLLVHEQAVPLAGLQITLGMDTQGNQRIDFFGRPAYLRLNDSHSHLILEKAQKLLAKNFTDLYEKLGRPALVFNDICEDGHLSDFSLSLMKDGFKTEPVYKQIIDLQPPLEELWQGVRKSYRSLIHWGEKNLSLKVYDRTNISSNVIEEFRQLHVEVAQRETRSVQSWECQFKQVKQGDGFVIMGHLDNRLVTSALFLHSEKFCYYGVGVSVRELFDKPLAHSVIWTGILEARQHGCRYLEMGDLANIYGNFSDKEKSIATFKSGFGGKTKIFLKLTSA